MPSERSQRRAHPPRPTLTFRVGVAGTRDPVAGVAGLEEQIRKVLRQTRDRVGAVHAGGLYDHATPPRMLLICSLAAGADQFVAGIALEEGYCLQVPLAVPGDQYAKSNFTDKGLMDEGEWFEKYLKQATAVLELDGGPDENAAYDAAGSALVGHSDVLLAIWDGGAGKGPGGTADSVRKAVAAGIPVVRFLTDGATAKVEYGLRQDLETEVLPDIVRDILQEGLEAPHDAAPKVREERGGDFARERKSLQDYCGERESRWSLDWPFRLLVTLFTLRWPGVPWKRMERYADTARATWAGIKDEQRPDCARGFFRPLDMWADCLAVYYANWMRGVVALTLMAGTLVVANALAGRLGFADAGAWREWAFGAISVLSVTAVGYARYQRIHRRWLQYRMLSERLRCAALAAGIGGLSEANRRAGSPGEFTPSWVAFYFNAVVRSFGLGHAKLDHDYLLVYRGMLAERLGGQYRYHAARRKKNAILDRRVRRLGQGIFLFSLLGTLAGMMAGMPGLNPPVDFTALALMLVAPGAAVAALAAQENFAKLAQVSGALAPRMSWLAEDVAKAPLSGILLRAKAGAAIEAMMEEHEDWYLLYSLRGIEYTG